MKPETLPRLPVFGWDAFGGQRAAGMPCLLDHPRLQFTTSGRASILLALEVLGVKPGDRVLLPTYHCPTMVAPVTHLGAVPVFYPVNAQGGPDLGWLAAQPLAGVRVLLAAHYFGLPRSLQPARQWCDAAGISLIEDCAHALFGQAGERPVGSWGDVAIGSLTKFLPVPEGGCLVVNRAAGAPPPLRQAGVAQQLKSAVDMLDVGASQGQLRGLNAVVGSSLGLVRRLRGGRGAPAAPTPLPPPGLPASGDELVIDATLAHRALAHPARWVARLLPRERIVAQRRENYAWLARELTGQAGMHPLLPELPEGCAPYVFPLWVQVPDPGYLALRRLGIPVFRWDRLWPGMPRIAGDYGHRWSHHVIQLACHQDLSQADLRRIVDALRGTFTLPGAP